MPKMKTKNGKETMDCCQKTDCQDKTECCENQRACACTYPGCPRKGICCECVAYHRDRGELPGCYFTPEEERTYERSIGYFVKCRS